MSDIEIEKVDVRAVLTARRLREAIAAYNDAARDAIDLNMGWTLTTSFRDDYVASKPVIGEHVSGLAVGNIIQRVKL